MKRLKLSNKAEIRQALSRIANMVLNGQMDSKSVNAIVYIANSILGTLDKENLEGSQEDMKTNRQATIQHLLRAAEITGDGERREQYLNEADKLIRQELSAEAMKAAKKAGIFKDE